MHTIRPPEQPVLWYVTDALGNDTILPNFVLPEAVLTPEPTLEMRRMVNSTRQTPVGDGKPKAGFLELPNGILQASSVIALYRQLTDLRDALRTAVRLTHIEPEQGELSWELWPAASWIGRSASVGGKTAGFYNVSGLFGVKELEPVAVQIIGYRVVDDGSERILNSGERRVVVERFGGST